MGIRAVARFTAWASVALGAAACRDGARTEDIVGVSAQRMGTQRRDSVRPGGSLLGLAAAPVGIPIKAGDRVRVTITDAECASIGDVMRVLGPVSGVVSTDACFGVGASITLGPSPADGELTFELDDPRFGVGTFRVSGAFPSFTVEMEDGFGDGDFNDNVLSVVILRSDCPPSGDPRLDSPEVRVGLLDALRASNPDSAPGSGFRMERGGVIWRRTDGTFFATEVTPLRTTECLFDADFGRATRHPPEPGAVPVAKFHTHPSGTGDPVFSCRSTPRHRYAQFPGDRGVVPEARPDVGGGGSPADWEDGTADGFPLYVINKDGRVYRLDPDTRPADRDGNPNRWEWKRPARPGCFSSIP